MRRHTLTALALPAAVALGLSACGSDDAPTSPGQETSATDPVSEPTGDDTPIGEETEDPVETDPAPTETVTATETETETEAATSGGSETSRELTATCEAEEFTISYPGAWQTNSGETIDDCRTFHPGEVSVEPDQGRDLHYAVTLYTDPVPFSEAKEGDSRDEELSRELTVVAGRDAVVIETRSSGQGLVPEGEETYTYIVDLGEDRILVASTYTIGDTDYDADKATLDEMMDTLELSTS